jgi:hypothetical protein
MPPCADPVTSILSQPSSKGWLVVWGSKPSCSKTAYAATGLLWSENQFYLLVHNSVWMHQLMYLKPALLQKLNAVAGDNLVTDIVLRVGEIPSREVVSDTAPAIDCDSTLSEILVSEAASYVSAIQDPDLRLQFTSVISKNLRPPAQPGRGPSRVP